MDNAEWGEGFVRTVKQMREAQKNFFQSRSLEWLERAKHLEKQVDRLAKEFCSPDSQQRRLF